MEIGLSSKTVDLIVNRLAKVVISALRGEQEPPTEMVDAQEAAKILGITDKHLRRIKDRFPHRKVGNSRQGRLLFERDGLLKNYIDYE